MKFPLRIAAAAFAFTVPILSGIAQPSMALVDISLEPGPDAPVALTLGTQPSAAPDLLDPAARPELILEDTPITVSGVLPMFTVQQHHTSASISWCRRWSPPPTP